MGRQSLTWLPGLEWIDLLEAAVNTVFYTPPSTIRRARFCFRSAAHSEVRGIDIQMIGVDNLEPKTMTSQVNNQEDGEYSGYNVRLRQSGWRSITVPSVTLKVLMAGLDRVDFLDMDIEGQELPVIRATIEEMNAKVKRVHIGTHGKEIEEELCQLLSAHGWHCLRDYTLFSSSETPFGAVAFENRVQSWVNPRL